MTIIADRGLFVRLPVQSGKFEQSSAEALADSLGSASKDPATRLDLLEVKSEIALVKAEIASVRLEIGALGNELKAGDALLLQHLEAQTNKLLVRLGGLMIVVAGLLFAALRLTN